MLIIYSVGIRFVPLHTAFKVQTFILMACLETEFQSEFDNLDLGAFGSQKLAKQ